MAPWALPLFLLGFYNLFGLWGAGVYFSAVFCYWQAIVSGLLLVLLPDNGAKLSIAGLLVFSCSVALSMLTAPLILLYQMVKYMPYLLRWAMVATVAWILVANPLTVALVAMVPAFSLPLFSALQLFLFIGITFYQYTTSKTPLVNTVLAAMILLNPLTSGLVSLLGLGKIVAFSLYQIVIFVAMLASVVVYRPLTDKIPTVKIWSANYVEAVDTAFWRSLVGRLLIQVRDFFSLQFNPPPESRTLGETARRLITYASIHQLDPVPFLEYAAWRQKRAQATMQQLIFDVPRPQQSLVSVSVPERDKTSFAALLERIATIEAKQGGPDVKDPKLQSYDQYNLPVSLFARCRQAVDKLLVHYGLTEAQVTMCFPRLRTEHEPQNSPIAYEDFFPGTGRIMRDPIRLLSQQQNSDTNASRRFWSRPFSRAYIDELLTAQAEARLQANQTLQPLTASMGLTPSHARGMPPKLVRRGKNLQAKLDCRYLGGVFDAIDQVQQLYKEYQAYQANNQYQPETVGLSFEAYVAGRQAQVRQHGALLNTLAAELALPRPEQSDPIRVISVNGSLRTPVTLDRTALRRLLRQGQRFEYAPALAAIKNFNNASAVTQFLTQNEVLLQPLNEAKLCYLLPDSHAIRTNIRQLRNKAAADPVTSKACDKVLAVLEAPIQFPTKTALRITLQRLINKMGVTHLRLEEVVQKLKREAELRSQLQRDKVHANLSAHDIQVRRREFKFTDAEYKACGYLLKYINKQNECADTEKEYKTAAPLFPVRLWQGNRIKVYDARELRRATQFAAYLDTEHKPVTCKADLARLPLYRPVAEPLVTALHHLSRLVERQPQQIQATRTLFSNFNSRTAS